MSSIPMGPIYFYVQNIFYTHWYNHTNFAVMTKVWPRANWTMGTNNWTVIIEVVLIKAVLIKGFLYYNKSIGFWDNFYWDWCSWSNNFFFVFTEYNSFWCDKTEKVLDFQILSLVFELQPLQDHIYLLIRQLDDLIIFLTTDFTKIKHGSVSFFLPPPSSDMPLAPCSQANHVSSTL